MKINSYKGTISFAAGIISSIYGGWDAAMTTLLLFMGLDYVTGLLVAGVFHHSPKSDNGALESRAGWKGLCRKGVTMLIVLIGARMDLFMGIAFVKDAIVIAFIIDELLSIIENVGLMGIPVPTILTKAIDILQQKIKK